MVREPMGWRVDAKWLTGVLLVLVLAAAIPLLSFSQLTTRERGVPILEEALRLTLLPPGSDGSAAEVDADLGFVAGEPLELIPGTGVYAESGELEELTAKLAAARVAAALSERVVRSGALATQESLAEARFRERFGAVMAGPGASLVRSILVVELLPAGLDNGSRLANWRLQARQNPAEPVQPIVGVFIRLPSEELATMTPREIGERVIVDLAELLLEQGLAPAQEVVTNQNLRRRLRDAAVGPIEQQLRQLIEAMLLFSEEAIEERLSIAREAVQAAAATRAAAGPLVTSEELAGLSVEEANSLILPRLAQRGYDGGPEAVADLLNDPGQRSRLLLATPLLESLSLRAHRDYRRNAWFFGAAAVLLVMLLALLSRGWGRLANPGLAISLAAAGGVLLFTKLAQLLSAGAGESLPGSLAAQGAFGHLARLVTFIAASLPSGALELVVRQHLVVLVTGVALVALSLLLRLLRAVRPRRRSLL